MRLDFLVEGVGPGPTGSARWSGASGSGHRPARQRLLRRRARSPPAPPGRCWSAAASGSHRSLCCAGASPSGRPPASCSASATRAHSGGLDEALRAAAEVRLASEDGHAGHRGYVTDLLAAMLAGDDAGSAVVYSCGPPAMLEAVRALRRARRRLRAGAGVADGLWLRRLLRLRRARSPRAATCASASTARCVRGDEIEDSDGRGWAGALMAPRRRFLRHRAGPPGDQRLGDLRRDRRPARLRRRAAGGLPLRRLRLEDDHAGAARRQRAAADLGDAGRDDQLDRAAEQGAGGIPRRGPAASWPSCRCR